MIRGTTPTHIFTIPFDTALIADLRISYAQCGKEVVVKKKEDATLDGQTITVKLSQEETFNFDCSKRVLVQVRVLTLGGEAVSSEVMVVSVEQCLNNEVLKYET
jgi:hypothetical protein